MSREIKYKNFTPLSKIEKNNKNKIKRIKTFILILLSINVYLFPINVMKTLESEIEDDKEVQLKKEDVTINMLSELSKYNIEKFNIQNNVLNLEVEKEKKSDIVEFLESKSLNLKEIESNDEKVNIKVEI